VCAVIVVLLLLIMIGGKNEKKTDVRALTLSALMIALATVLGQIKLFEMPQGGSVTLLSILPIAACGYLLGTRRGVMAGFCVGLINLIFGPYVIHPVQLLMDYPIAFGALGLAAVFGADFFGGVAPVKAAASIGIISGADGPTAIWLTSRLAPDLLGAIAVAAYSYMALVPIIQPPIMNALTTKSERLIKMPPLREVKKIEKVCFPLIVLLLCAVLLPSAVPLIGALMLGNLAKEAGPSVARISDTMSNALINIVTIMLGLSVGSKLACEKFLSGTTLGILALGLVAFCVGTAAGVIMAKLMNLVSKEKVNPLIGSAGVSAVPMAARVSNKVSLQNDPTNFILMQAMGPNVSGVIGSAVVAGVLYTLCR
jgi:oxaloacetate decarboxylase beta subunit